MGFPRNEVLVLCDLAVAKGYLRPDERDSICRKLAAAPAEQAKGEWLVENGVLTPEQLRELREEVPTTPSRRRSGKEASVHTGIGRIGRFEIQREIGRGAMGIVYVAKDPVLNAPVAVKVLPQHVVQDEEDRLRMLREAQSAALLRDHANIVTVYEASMEDPAPYVVMEFVEGDTLRSLIEQAYEGGRGLPSEEALGYATQVANGLAEAHRRGLIHRDIKPQNLMVTDATPRVLKILDFGIAKNLMPGSTVTEPGAVPGTYLYLPPELLAITLGLASDDRALRSSPKTDVYALGVTLWETLAGYNPWRDAGSFARLLELKQQAGRCDDLPALPGELSEHMKHAISRLIAPDPAGRCADGGEAIELLQGLGRPTPAPFPPPTMPEEQSEAESSFLEEYWFGDRCIKLYMGDITDLEVDVIASSDDNHITMNGGVSNRILEVGGQIIQEEAHQQLPSPPGEVLVTSAGALKCQFVFHALVIDLDKLVFPTLETIAQCTRGVFAKADRLGLQTVALPALASGSAGLALRDVTRTMLEAVVRAFTDETTNVRNVILAFLKTDEFAGFVRSQVLAIVPTKAAIRRRTGHSKASERFVPNRKARAEPKWTLSRHVLPSTEAELPQLDGYRVERERFLGEMFTTYEAAHEVSGTRVFLSLIAEEHKYPARLDEELRELARLGLHPHLLPVLQVGQAEQIRFLTQEFWPGDDLESHVTTNGPLDERSALRQWARVADAVAYLHEHNVVLRSLRPQKILIAIDRPHLRILDYFSWKLRAASAGEGATLHMGTPSVFTAPEVMLGEEVGKHSDVFVLGVLLHFMLTGRDPFERADSSDRLLARMCRGLPNSALQDVQNRKLRRLVEIATAPAENRPRSVTELLEFLKSSEGGEEDLAHERGFLRRLRRLLGAKR